MTRKLHKPLLRVPWALLLCSVAFSGDVDSDGDGLSDFQEEHKYFTNPRAADSDGDGTPDGEWRERREYAYTIRSVVRVMRPVDIPTLSDDYQDARVLDETRTNVKLEVIHYPLNTVAEAIRGNSNWRDDYAQMTEFLAPGRTSDWDDDLHRTLISLLKKDGIAIDKLDDKQLVERASNWLLRHARYEGDQFTTFFTYFPEGKPAVFPGLKPVVESYNKSQRTLEKQWARDLFARSMFEQGARGSCTSSAIYLNGCLRALGIPTRIILCIPVIDASDARELEMVRKNLKHAECAR